MSLMPRPPYATEAEILEWAREVTAVDFERIGLFKNFPILRTQYQDADERGQKNGWRPVWYLWPDLVIGFFKFAPDDDGVVRDRPSERVLINAYREWRKERELEVMAPAGRA